MLKFLRHKKTAKKIWIGLALIIIPAFAFWGFGGAGDTHKDNSSAGKIFGKNISSLEFKDSLVAVRTMAIMQFGDKLPEIEKYFNFQAQAWERLMLLYEAKRRRISVKDQEVIKEIRSAPYFQNKGVFSNKIYQEILRYALRLQPRAFEEQTRQNLILAKLYDQITQDLKLTDEQIRQEYLKINQEISIDYIISRFSEFTDTIRPEEKEIRNYFEQNKAMFKEPPSGNQPARIPELTEIQDKVKSAFIDAAAKAAAQEKINACSEKLKHINFSQAASDCGLLSGTTEFFKSNGIIENLGPAEIFWNRAKELKGQETSAAFFNGQGYYIIRLKSVKPIDENQFLQEKDDLSLSLLNSKKNELFAAFIQQLKQKAQ